MFILLFILLFKNTDKFQYINLKKNNLISIKNLYLQKNIYNFGYFFEYFNIFDIKYYYSFKFNNVKIEYKIEFFDINEYPILPSDLLLNFNFYLVCYIEIVNKNKVLHSLPFIDKNNYYKCIEFFNIKEKIKFGIKIYKIKENDNNIEDYLTYLFSDKLFKYDNVIYKNDDLFDPLIINEKYLLMIKEMNDEKINETLRLKQSYIKYPNSFLKINAIINEDIWIYENIYNEYFCYCIGLNCINSIIPQKCKYYFYLYIIDNNRNIYPKTDFLFIDFIFTELSSDDAYPIFKRMAYKNFPVHYITENLDIYNEFCFNISGCLTVILVNKDNFTINGDFLEKHLTLFLKLKQVISGSGTYFNYLNNLFYNIEYITYISITHGVCFFKYFLYEDFACYGKKRIDKILIPPSKKIIDIAKKYGWKDENMIKINLPKWDKYKNYVSIIDKNENIKINSIFLLFTWREVKKKKKISTYYFQNIINIVTNKLLQETLKKNNLILYFTFHHKINNYNQFKSIFQKKQIVQFIEEKEISECLSKTNLIVSDFSSVIFDLISRGKPFILYVPDGNDPEIETIYSKNYYELIRSFQNGTLEFENKCYDVNQTINKIIFYINNNFNLEPKLKKFKTNLGLNYGNNIDQFIEYIKNIK